jgi:hypothetical protein
MNTCPRCDNVLSKREGKDLQDNIMDCPNKMCFFRLIFNPNNEASIYCFRLNSRWIEIYPKEDASCVKPLNGKGFWVELDFQLPLDITEEALEKMLILV